jgi:hypothetical protein
MTTSTRFPSYVSDPLLFALEMGQRVGLEVIDRAITHREFRIRHADNLTRGLSGPMSQGLQGYADEWAAEITALKAIRRRLIDYGHLS